MIAASVACTGTSKSPVLSLVTPPVTRAEITLAPPDRGLGVKMRAPLGEAVRRGIKDAHQKRAIEGEAGKGRPRPAHPLQPRLELGRNRAEVMEAASLPPDRLDGGESQVAAGKRARKSRLYGASRGPAADDADGTQQRMVEQVGHDAASSRATTLTRWGLSALAALARPGRERGLRSGRSAPLPPRGKGRRASARRVRG